MTPVDGPRCVAHPNRAAYQLCPQCSDWRCQPCTVEGCGQPGCPLQPEEAWRDSPCPLEAAPEQWWRTAPKTLARVWTDPAGFFARLPREGPLGPALFLAIALGTLPWWGALAKVVADGHLSLPLAMWVALPMPMLAAVRLGWVATTTQLLLLLLGHPERPRSTTRWISYTASVDVLGLLPGLGPLIVGPFGVLWRTLALRSHLRLAWWQCGLIAAFPTGAGWLMVLALLTGVAWWTGISF